MGIALSFLSTLFIIFFIPILVYGLFSLLSGLKEPEKKLSFFAGILIQKIGTTVGFVGLFVLGKETFGNSWMSYSLMWVAMYGITEIGQMFMSDYSKKEALAGILSEILYFPLAGIAMANLLKV